MHLTSKLPTLALEDLYGQVMYSNCLINADRQKLKTVLLSEFVSHSEIAIIDRLLYNVRRGWLRVAN